VRLEDLHRLPGEAPAQETVLEAGDLIVGLRLPASARNFSGHARSEVRERTSYAFAVVSAAACLSIERQHYGSAYRSAGSRQNPGARAR
jgi:xanthine dehydrogenase YagS FAD-binding subunit